MGEDRDLGPRNVLLVTLLRGLAKIMLLGPAPRRMLQSGQTRALRNSA